MPEYWKKNQSFYHPTGAVPAKKTDLVFGHYELDLPNPKPRTITPKIIDMLGEEVVITKRI